MIERKENNLSSFMEWFNIRNGYLYYLILDTHECKAMTNHKNPTKYCLTQVENQFRVLLTSITSENIA